MSWPLCTPRASVALMATSATRPASAPRINLRMGPPRVGGCCCRPTLWPGRRRRNGVGHSQRCVAARESGPSRLRVATMRWLARPLAAEVREHGQHTAVRLGVQVEAELEEDLLDVRLDGALGHDEAACDRAVGEAFG